MGHVHQQTLNLLHLPCFVYIVLYAVDKGLYTRLKHLAINCYWFCYVRMYLLKINLADIDNTAISLMFCFDYLHIFWFCTYRLTPHDRDTAWTGAYWVKCDLSTMTQSPHTFTFIAQVTVPKALKFPHHKKYVCSHFTFVLCSTFPPYCSTSVCRTVRWPLRAAFKTAVKPSCGQRQAKEAKARQKFMYHTYTSLLYKYIDE